MAQLSWVDNNDNNYWKDLIMSTVIKSYLCDLSFIEYKGENSQSNITRNQCEKYC